MGKYLGVLGVCYNNLWVGVLLNSGVMKKCVKYFAKHLAVWSGGYYLYPPLQGLRGGAGRGIARQGRGVQR
jgi:hypothetical protein